MFTEPFVVPFHSDECESNMFTEPFVVPFHSDAPQNTLARKGI